jgi:phosphoribosylaminoimidazole (AIR) synthetase
MFRTFNMGIGMVIVGAEENIPTLENYLRATAEPWYRIGSVIPGRRQVILV